MSNIAPSAVTCSTAPCREVFALFRCSARAGGVPDQPGLSALCEAADEAERGFASLAEFVYGISLVESREVTTRADLVVAAEREALKLLLEGLVPVV